MNYTSMNAEALVIVGIICAIALCIDRIAAVLAG